MGVDNVVPMSVPQHDDFDFVGLHTLLLVPLSAGAIFSERMCTTYKSLFLLCMISQPPAALHVSRLQLPNFAVSTVARRIVSKTFELWMRRRLDALPSDLVL